MQPPLITLTTDFGLQDHYVGTMKGVILSRCPTARLIDINHQIPPFSLYPAAYTIDQAARYFPRGTIHVVVVDPGVGTRRKPLLVEAAAQLFIAPDNGVMSLILAADSAAQTRELSNPELWLPSPSTTFHGRDIFAPTAAALAAGTAQPEDVGPLLNRPVLLADLEPYRLEGNSWQGIVLSVDHFGNVITNFSSVQFSPLLEGQFAIHAGAGRITAWRSTFGGAARDLCFAYLGSSGFVELAVNQGNAARALQLNPGDPVRFETCL